MHQGSSASTIANGRRTIFRNVHFYDPIAGVVERNAQACS